MIKTASQTFPMAVVLTTGTSYTVPAGAVTMKAWAVGCGDSTSFNNGQYGGGAGGVSYKTWTVSGGQSVTYKVGYQYVGTGGNTTVTFSGSTITGNGGGL